MVVQENKRKILSPWRTFGEENLKATKENLNWPGTEPFFVPDEVRAHMDEIIRKDRLMKKNGMPFMKSTKKHIPELAKEWETGTIKPFQWNTWILKNFGALMTNQQQQELLPGKC